MNDFAELLLKSSVDCSCETRQSTEINVSCRPESKIGVEKVLKLFVFSLSDLSERIGGGEDLLKDFELLVVFGDVGFLVGNFFENCVFEGFEVFDVSEDKVSLINGVGESGIEKSLRID